MRIADVQTISTGHCLHDCSPVCVAPLLATNLAAINVPAAIHQTSDGMGSTESSVRFWDTCVRERTVAERSRNARCPIPIPSVLWRCLR